MLILYVIDDLQILHIPSMGDWDPFFDFEEERLDALESNFWTKKDVTFGMGFKSNI